MIHRWKKQEERGGFIDFGEPPPTHPTAFWLDALSGAIGAWCSQGSRTTSLWSRPPSFSQSVVTTRDLLFPQRTGYIYATCLLWLPYYKIQSSLQNWSSTTTIHISIVSVYRITKKKREIQSFWTSACKSVVSLSLCSTSPSRYKGWGRKEGTHLLDAPSVRVLSPSSSHSLPHDR